MDAITMEHKRCAEKLLLFTVLAVLVVSITNQIAEAYCYDFDDYWPRRGCEFISCDDLGEAKDTFSLDEDVYVKGGCFGARNDVNIYVLPNGERTKPENAVSGPIPSTTDDDCHLPITLVWSSPLIPGKYDIWVDVNQNGIFEWWLDGHYYCVCRPYLLHVIPEYFVGSIGSLIAMFGSFTFLYRRAHK